METIMIIPTLIQALVIAAAGASFFLVFFHPEKYFFLNDTNLRPKAEIVDESIYEIN